MREKFSRYLKDILADSYICYGRPGKIADGGRLIVAGGGIGARDLLQDIPALLSDSDYVMVCLADQVTQKSIYDSYPEAVDLTCLYAEGKDRHATYLQMAELMIAPARNGKKVLAIFYGHPGLFASATHRAIAIARNEGISAHMRPGISALDYAIADLGFDPAFPGLGSFEATDLLMRNRPLDPTVHNVIWQVGMVGEAGYRASGFDNKGLAQLKRHMLRYYPTDHVVTNYIGSSFAGTRPIMLPFALADLDTQEVAEQIIAYSTLYVPPSIERPYDRNACVEMGWVAEGQSLPSADAYKTDLTYSDVNQSLLDASGVEFLTRTTNPSDENPFYRLVDKLNADPSFSDWYETHPEEAIWSMRLDISDEHKEVMVSTDFRRIEDALFQYDAHKSEVGKQPNRY